MNNYFIHFLVVLFYVISVAFATTYVVKYDYIATNVTTMAGLAMITICLSFAKKYELYRQYESQHKTFRDESKFSVIRVLFMFVHVLVGNLYIVLMGGHVTLMDEFWIVFICILQSNIAAGEYCYYYYDLSYSMITDYDTLQKENAELKASRILNEKNEIKDTK